MSMPLSKVIDNLSEGLHNNKCADCESCLDYIKSKNEKLILKCFKGALSGLRQYLATESPLKMMKNAFFPPQKLFSSLRYLSFCHDFLVMYQNGLIKKIGLISNFMTSQPG